MMIITASYIQAIRRAIFVLIGRGLRSAAAGDDDMMIEMMV